MLSVERVQRYEQSPAEMWGKIGDFHGAASWHPAIESSDASEDGTQRTLHLGDDGGSILETRTAEGDQSYSYRIEESPLPISNYEATLAVRDAPGGGSEVVWSSQFDADGVSDEEAQATVGGIFDAGLGNL